MAMQALRDGASGGILKYFLMGLLVLAAGGLVFTDVGGFFRGGIASTDAAKIGDEKISINRFDRNVRQSLGRLGLSPEQAYKLGYIRDLLNGEIRTSLLKQEARDIGVVISTQEVANNIRKLVRPMVGPGQQTQDVLRQILQAQGMSEQAFVESIRGEMASNLIGASLQAGFADVSEGLARDLARFEQEKRSVQYVVFKNKDFKDVQKPTEQQLLALYEGTKEAYSKPEVREGQLAVIKTDNLKNTLDISDEEIRDIYERDISSYSQPEKRSVEQVIASDAAQAEEIAAAVKSGKTLKTASNDVLGNTTDYLPPKSLEKIELLDELQDTVFSAAKKDVIGPVESGLGYHVVVVKNITPAQTQKFESERKTIKNDLTETRLLDAQYDLANTVEDLLASGVELDALKEEVDIEIISLNPSNSRGTQPNGKSAFKNFGEDAPTLLENLFDLGEGEASPVFELSDERMVALFVKSITPKSYTPFEEIKDTLEKRWMDDARRSGNKMAILETLSELQSESGSLKETAKAHRKTLQKLSNIKRGEEQKAPLTPQAGNAIFEAPLNTPFILELDGAAAIAVVTDSKVPETLKDKDLQNLEKDILSSTQNEAFAIYIEKLQREHGVRVNDKLLEAVYGQRDAQ